jgi:hypothetical protein
MEIRFIKKETLDAIGDAIRNKANKTGLIPPEDMPTEIEGIGGEPLDIWVEGGHAEVNLPNATKIRESVFYKDTTLTNVNMPNVTEIGKGAFNSCTNLVSVSMPKVEIIGISAFMDCAKLAITEIPSGVTEIGATAFSRCYGLTTITFKGTPTKIASSSYASIFQSCTNLKTINVPWAEGEVEGAPWGATNAQINYNYTGE